MISLGYENRLLKRKVAALELPKVTAIDVMIRDGKDEALLNGAGLLVANAPFTLADNLQMLLPELTGALQQGSGGGFRIEQLGTEAFKGAADMR